MLYLVWPRIATRRLLLIRILAVTGTMAIAARLRLPVLARRAHFAPGFQPSQVELRDGSLRLCANAPHVKTLVDAPARDGREIGQIYVRVVLLGIVVGDGSRWR